MDVISIPGEDPIPNWRVVLVVDDKDQITIVRNDMDDAELVNLLVRLTVILHDRQG